MNGFQYTPPPKFQAYVKHHIHETRQKLAKQFNIQDQNLLNRALSDAYIAAKKENFIHSTANLKDKAGADQLLRSFEKHLRASLAPPEMPNNTAPSQPAASTKPLSEKGKLMHKINGLAEKLKTVRNPEQKKALVKKAFPNMPQGKEALFLKKLSLQVHPDKNPDMREEATKAAQSLNNIREVFT